jgi:hypothetical protein
MLMQRRIGTTKDALILLAAAAVAFLGAALLPTVSTVASILETGGPGVATRGFLLVTVVTLLAATGVLLVGLSLSELLPQSRPGPVRVARAREDRGDHPVPGDPRRG